MDSLALALQANARAESQYPPESLPPMSLGPLWSEDFALALGLKRSSIPDYAYPRDELERMSRITFNKHCNSRFPEPQQEIIWSRFCALYLPATISKFLNPPPAPKPEWSKEMLINNAYLDMLVGIQHSPYFFKYLRSNKPAASSNKVFTNVFAERFLDIIPEWEAYMTGQKPIPEDRPDDYFHDTAGTILQLLSTLLVAYIKDLHKEEEPIIPTSTRRQLVPWLNKWARRYRNDYLGEVAGRNAAILSGDKEFEKGVRMVRRKMKGWDECAMAGCGKSGELKMCSRCQTVRYCSPEHQKTHWSLPVFGHKDHCFKTEY